ncbi:hypothetical protein WJX79_001484 [Trebouxia sp. C0005]
MLYTILRGYYHIVDLDILGQQSWSLHVTQQKPGSMSHKLQFHSGTAIFVPAPRRTFTLPSAEDKAPRGMIRTEALTHHVRPRAPFVRKVSFQVKSLLSR